MPEQTVQHRRTPARRVINDVRAFPVDAILGLIGTAALGGVLLVGPLLLTSACAAVAAGCGGLMVVRNRSNGGRTR